MNDSTPTVNRAEVASERAMLAVRQCLENGDSFLLEAGAGAGKTYSLVEALRFLTERDQWELTKFKQRIACLTYTNVAKDEIIARTDRNPIIYCDTIHGFCWSISRGFQKQIKSLLQDFDNWTERISEAGELDDCVVEYHLGHRSIRNGCVSIHHDDVLQITASLMEHEKFRRLVSDRFPVVLIDEYQDTNTELISSIITHFLGCRNAPQFGFFGDHWQQIYRDGCGKIEHESLTVIGKEVNFRSVQTIVDCLNRIRPELPQFVRDPEEPGRVLVFHTNDWISKRQTGNHWGGDLPSDASRAALTAMMQRLDSEGWYLSSETTKILMLTHRVLAAEQGYSSLPGVFDFNESFTKKEDEYIAFLVDHIIPACEAFVANQFGSMFETLGSRVPTIRYQADKQAWSDAMRRLVHLTKNGTVKDVVQHLREVRRPQLPDGLEQREQELEQFDQSAGEEMPRRLRELCNLHSIRFSEISALADYHMGHSPFETKHGVKGAEFENVVVVVGRGWNIYNFNRMLEQAQRSDEISPNEAAQFERNRNLFYVVCSRPKKNLALLFTQELSVTAMQTVEMWFGGNTIEPLSF